MVFTTSETIIATLSNQIIKTTVRNAAEKLNTMLNNVKTPMDLFVRNDQVETILSSKTNGFGNYPSVLSAASDTMKKAGTAFLTCLQRENLTGQITPAAKLSQGPMWRNVTGYLFADNNLQLKIFEKNNITGIPFANLGFNVGWTDYDNSSTSFFRQCDPNSGDFIGPFLQPGPWASPNSSLFANTVALDKFHNNEITQNWVAEQFGAITYFTYAVIGNDRTGKYSTGAGGPFVCVAPIMALKSIFDELTPTPSSRIFLIGNTDKLILTNQNIQVGNPETGELGV
ncbi:hypothetical protein HK098_005670 [Nowakowskiella sp. JEL0407]|nr:hypothetical protein HK098_005670 [Nowakowskiella sp. JEL0407]